MISTRTKELILETARIEEVVGEFVKLKKRGGNMLGLCPFHHEKSPSFNVNPQRNIYKCFGCGKGGDAVTFIMEHEHFTFPEALRYLARKYQIEVEEDASNEENKEQQQERESLYIVSGYAQRYFTEQLLTGNEGKAVGLSYFHERGFRDDIIAKFQLGYSPGEWEVFSKAALAEGYEAKYLVQTGLSIAAETPEGQTPPATPKIHDRFRGRVMFPIHNLSGRVIGFGGRILKSDAKAAKYLNSPDSDIYHKSQVLYGIFYAKKDIIAQDNCYLVEGYTDVISMHQCGVENVVASSGTSLTTDQIRLISRYTKNITVLYDGDAAGIKASLRGIDMILEEGLNVRVVQFPEGEDPDSFARRSTTEELRTYITRQAVDFIRFKAGLLMQDAAGDPVRKAALIRDIVESIAKVPDAILRSEYIKDCSRTMDIGEQILIAEVNKMARQQQKKNLPGDQQNDYRDLEELLPHTIQPDSSLKKRSTEHQERDILRLLFNYGHLTFKFDIPDTEESQMLGIAPFIVHEIQADEMEFENELYGRFFKEFETIANDLVMPEGSTRSKQENHFLSHADSALRMLAVDLVSTQHLLSEQWKEKHKINVPREDELLKAAVYGALYSLKLRKLQIMAEALIIQIKEEKDEDTVMQLMAEMQLIDQLKAKMAALKGTVLLS